MDLFRNNLGIRNDDIVEFADGRVGIAWDELEEGRQFVCHIFTEDEEAMGLDIFDAEDIREVLHTSDLKISKNAIRCNECGDEIESLKPYDNIRCKCGACRIDGGTDYLRRYANPKATFTELSIVDI